VPPDMPYRGPADYRDGELLYKCQVDGAFDWYIGHEEIYKHDRKVYECVFHGGTLN